MAIPSVKIMVNDRLPYTAPSSFDVVIERIRVQMTYLMQGQTKKADVDVEVEANYRALENMLFASMVSYQLVKSKVVLNMAGDGTTAGTAAKTLKRAKADVTEAEFIIVKADDGAVIQMRTDLFLEQLLMEICTTGRTLGYSVPWCNIPLDEIPAFIVGADYPCAPLPSSGFLNGTIG
jgi:hypothetical protein